MVPQGQAREGPGPPARYRFDDVQVDTVAHTLTRGGVPCALEPKAFAVLAMLLEHAGELVEKDELLDAVWGHRHVTPGVLTRAIAQLRAALGDDAHQPRYIHTHHALGYRFIGDLQGGGGAGAPSAAMTAAPSDAPGATRAGTASADPEAHPDAGHGGTTDALPAPARPPEAATARRRLALGMLAAAGVLVLVTLMLTHGLSDPRPPVGEASVAVMPFRSLSADRGDRYFAEGLAVEMHGALAGVPGLKVAALVPGRDDDTPGDPRELGKRLGVANVLDASVRREGPRVRISARLTDTRSGFVLWSQTYDRQNSDIFSTQAEIASKVVEALMGVLPPDPPALARRLHPTSRLSAYEPYLKGLQLLQGTASTEQLTEAVAHFEQALQQDPAFARAQAGICRARIRAFELTRDVGVYARAQAACLQAARLDPRLGEVHLAMGDLHRARNELDAARESYTQALQDVSLRPAAYIGLGRIEGEQGHDALALDYFDRARQLRPGDAVVHREIGYQHYLDDRIAAAIESYRVATTLEPDDAGLWSSLGGLYLADGRRADAEASFERSLSIKPGFGALSNLGTLRFEQGDYPRAAELYARAAAMSPGDYRPVGNTADALSAIPGAAGNARSTYARAAEMAERYVAIKSGDAEAMAWLAWYRANLDEADAARDWLARARDAGTAQSEVAFLAAQVHARLGDVDLARAALADARALDVAESRIRASPVLKSLSGGSEVASQGGS